MLRWIVATDDVACWLLSAALVHELNRPLHKLPNWKTDIVEKKCGSGPRLDLPSSGDGSSYHGFRKLCHGVYPFSMPYRCCFVFFVFPGTVTLTDIMNEKCVHPVINCVRYSIVMRTSSSVLNPYINEDHSSFIFKISNLRVFVTGGEYIYITSLTVGLTVPITHSSWLSGRSKSVTLS